MLYAMTVTNFKGESLRLELAHPEKSGLLIYNIEGLGGGKANINSAELGSADGAFFTSSRITSRNIVIYLAMYELPGFSIEDARHLSYKYFPPKKEVTLTFETDSKTCYITGYVEANEPVIFSSEEHTQISVVCPDPFFYAMEPTTHEFSRFNALFEFPFCDDSVLSEVPEEDPVYENLLTNYDFSKPENYSTEDNNNLFSFSDFRLYPGIVPEGEVINGWGYTNTGDGDGTAILLTQGLTLTGPGYRIYEYLKFVYCMPTDDLEDGPYIFSILSKEYGLSSLKVDAIFSGDDRMLGELEIAPDIGIYIYYSASESLLKFGVAVYSQKVLTLLSGKAEQSEFQTLVSRTEKTEWHDIGPTIANWEIVSGLYGNFFVNIVKNSMITILDYPSNTEAVIWQQTVRVRKNEPLTLSIITSVDLYSMTFQIPEEKYESDWLELDDSYIARVLCAAGSDDAVLQICRFLEPEINNVARLELKIMKLEYSEFQTLAVKEGDKWVLKEPQPVASSEPTLEFGSIREGHLDIIYRGDGDIGLTITIHALGPAENITVFNPDTGEKFKIATRRIQQITGQGYSSGDDIVINTVMGHKSVRLLRGGFYTNIIGAMDRDSDWFVLTAGKNTFDITADSGINNLVATFSYNEAYTGV